MVTENDREVEGGRKLESPMDWNLPNQIHAGGSQEAANEHRVPQKQSTVSSSDLNDRQLSELTLTKDRKELTF